MWQQKLNRRRFIEAAAMLGAAAFLPLPWPTAAGAGENNPELTFAVQARAAHGAWSARCRLSRGYLPPGAGLTVAAGLTVTPELAAGLAAAGLTVDEYLLLVTAERCFDHHGLMRLPGGERMSTLLTPTGLAIEGGDSGAVSKRTGSRHRNPVDILLRIPAAKALRSADGAGALYGFEAALPVPADLPPGIYRLRFDLGVAAGKRNWSLNKESFAARQKEAANLSCLYSPPLLCSNTDAAGKFADAAAIRPRLYWVLLGQYNSGGYQGIVADEDKHRFALSGRHIIPDEVILPLYNAAGGKIAYSLEPIFPADTIDRQRNIPLDHTAGELSVTITDPSGRVTDLGTAPFTGAKGQWPTTGKPAFTAWKPPGYGRYTVTATGWVEDVWGNRYHGGGTYRFWIAKRMTMGTATFQGMSYPVGARYGRDIGFSPAVPAAVAVKVDHYPDSDPVRVRTLAYKGKATAGGLFGAAQGMQPFPLDAPGEYHAHVLATHTDSDGHLWVCSMRHAGVVYPPAGPLTARGKKLRIANQYIDRGETFKEGYREGEDNYVLEHVNFPYNAGDVLLIASDGQGANKIEPVLTCETAGATAPWDPRLNGIGATNVRITTANGLSPHMYPEYITDLAYYYAAAPRPGFSSRFIVGEDGARAPYWPTSATSFGGQIGATANGDMPGDIYRLIGGVVLRPRGQKPQYAGYMASAVILPAGSWNNRIIAPGAEDITGADGRPARFFLVPVRPGMVYEQGAAFTPVLQIDPFVPAAVRFVLRYPDGREKIATGTGDKSGYFLGAERWLLDMPGVYSYTVQAEWAGHTGRVPGLTPEPGCIFVLDKDRPPGGGLKLDLANQQTFPPAEGLLIEGTTAAAAVHYAAIMPGAVIDQGILPVTGGRFAYRFDPAAVNKKIPAYDIVNRRTGRADLGRIVHITFFAAEKTVDGSIRHSYVRVILRGNTAICAR